MLCLSFFRLTNTTILSQDFMNMDGVSHSILHQGMEQLFPSFLLGLFFYSYNLSANAYGYILTSVLMNNVIPISVDGSKSL